MTVQATHEVYFNDGSVEAVSGMLPPPEVQEEVAPGVVNTVPNRPWWDCTLLHVNEETKQYVSFGQISVNLNNVLFIKRL